MGTTKVSSQSNYFGILISYVIINCGRLNWDTVPQLENNILKLEIQQNLPENCPISAFFLTDMFSEVVLIQFVYFLDKQHKSRDTHQIRIQHSNSAYLSNGQTYNNYDLVI